VFVFKKLYELFSRHKLIQRNILIIGAGEAGQSLAAKLILEKGLGVNIIGFLDDNKKVGFEIITGKKIIGTINNLNTLSKKLRIDEIIIAIDNISYERLLEILDTCRQVDAILKISSDLFQIIPQKVMTEKYHDIPVINVSCQINASFSLITKRIFDIIVASVGLFFLSPVLGIVAILIKLSSQGPIIYTHFRIGKDGQPFIFYKFRSMIVSNIDDGLRKKRMIDFINEKNNRHDPDKKIVDENRITWIGKFIRKTSIDELPQLINVIKGNMSLVGPRPCLLYEYDHLEEWQKKRFSVLPGCTGVWQVLGRSSVSFTDSVVLDLYYINNMSPWLDLQLILKTVPVMVFGKGGK
jgi:undecaprenyl-phosphate galactose phosphotransferase